MPPAASPLREPRSDTLTKNAMSTDDENEKAAEGTTSLIPSISESRSEDTEHGPVASLDLDSQTQTEVNTPREPRQMSYSDMESVISRLEQWKARKDAEPGEPGKSGVLQHGPSQSSSPTRTVAIAQNGEAHHTATDDNGFSRRIQERLRLDPSQKLASNKRKNASADSQQARKKVAFADEVQNLDNSGSGTNSSQIKWPCVGKDKV